MAHAGSSRTPTEPLSASEQFNRKPEFQKRSPHEPPLPSSSGKDSLPLIFEEDDDVSSDSESVTLTCIELEDLRIEWRANAQDFNTMSSFSTISKSSQGEVNSNTESLIIRACRPRTLLPSGDLLCNKTFFDSGRKKRSTTTMPQGSSQAYVSAALALRSPMPLEALDNSVASTAALRTQLHRERRYTEAAVVSLLLLHHRVLILQPLLEFKPRRDAALRYFPDDVAGKWCFGSDDVLIFPGFHADASVLNFVLSEMVSSLPYLRDVEEAQDCGQILEYNEQTVKAVNRTSLLLCPSFHTHGMPNFDRIFKPVFAKRYFLMSPKQRLAAELVHVTALALHRLTEWALHEGEYGSALAFAQHQHLAELCLRNYYPNPERLRPYYLHTMTLWALGRVYSAMYDQFEEKFKMQESFEFTRDKLHDVADGLRSLHSEVSFEHEGRFPVTAEECLAVAGGFYRQVRVPAGWRWYNNQRNVTSNLHLVARLFAWIASIAPADRATGRKPPAELLQEVDGILHHAETLSYELAFRNTVHEIVVRCLTARAARCKQQWSLCGAVVQQDTRSKVCAVVPRMPSFFGMQQRRSAHKAALMYAQRPLLHHIMEPLGGRLLRRVALDAVMDVICALECKRNPQWIKVLMKTFIPIAQIWSPPHKMPAEDESRPPSSASTTHAFEGFHFESTTHLDPEQQAAFYPVMALLLYGLGISFTLLAETVLKVRAESAAQSNAEFVFTVAAPLLRTRCLAAFIVEAFMEEANLYQLFSVDYQRSTDRTDTTDSETDAERLRLASRAAHLRQRLAGVFTTMRKLTYLLPLLYEYCIAVKTVPGPKNYPLKHVASKQFVLPMKLFPIKSDKLKDETKEEVEGRAEAERYALQKALQFLRDTLEIKKDVAFSGGQTTDCPESAQDVSVIEFDMSLFSSFSSTDDVLNLNDDGEGKKTIKERPMVYGRDFGMKYEVLAEGSPAFPLENHYFRDQINYPEFETYTEDQYDKIFSNFEGEKIWCNDNTLENHLAKLRKMLSLLTQTAIMDLKFFRKNPQFCKKVKFLHLKGDSFSAGEWSVPSLMIELSLLYQRFVDPDDYVLLLITSVLYKLDAIVNAGRMARALRGEFVV